ncbi:hypothetical protein BKA93DRAFT_735482 [Sparassis latifolia]
MPAHGFRILPPIVAGDAGIRQDLGSLPLNPSTLCPDCRADERIFLWRGTNHPAASTLHHPVLQHLADVASRASLRDSTLSSYGSGLRKFHLFCDIFSIPDSDRLSASFTLLNSFILWAVAEPDANDLALADGTPFEPISAKVASKYLDAVRAWHLAQGWPPPLSPDDRARIQWSLRGLENLQQARRTRPPRPPVTLHMLGALKCTLHLDNPFEACLWAMASCAFWGLMCFGEVSVKSRASFSGTQHLKQRDAVFAHDLDGKPYVRLDLPSAKTAKPGEIQHMFLVEQGEVCPIAALCNLAHVVPAGEEDPLFSWRDHLGQPRPMVRDTALKFINSVFTAWGCISKSQLLLTWIIPLIKKKLRRSPSLFFLICLDCPNKEADLLNQGNKGANQELTFPDDWGTAFGHSFRIGGASFLLSQKVDPEIVCLMGR